MTNNTVPLILSQESVSARGPVKARTANVAVVYTAPDGHVEVFDSGRPDRWSRRAFSRFRLRYEVDTGDHRRTVELRSSPLPARGAMLETCG